MAKLKKPINLETAFNSYELTDQLGEGGAGRVYGGRDGAGQTVAVKILTSQSGDKRRRFKNEIAFLSRNRHANIVTVTDHGTSTTGGMTSPFYVMPLYAGSLRLKIRSLAPDAVMPLFSQILDGVEAAHLLGATHRDLKPENILLNAADQPAVADFGIASFTEDQLQTIVNTAPTQRLANFQYAAPEQRDHGKVVTTAADIYALGLILNELFTGSVPHGTDYQPIAKVSEHHAYLDPIVAKMIRQQPSERLASIASVKMEIQKFHAEAVSLQKLRELDKVVIPEGEVSDPLAHAPPKIIAADWDNGTLTLTLDQPVHNGWVQALYNIGNFTSLMGNEPHTFNFSGDRVSTTVRENDAQQVINYFKQWLPNASAKLKYTLEEQMKRDKREREQRLQQQRAAEERRLAVNRNLQF